MMNEREEALSLLRRWAAGPSPVYVVFSSPWAKGSEFDTEEEFKIETALVASVSECEIKLQLKSDPFVSVVLNIETARLRSSSAQELVERSLASRLDMCIEVEFSRGHCLIASFIGWDFDPAEDALT
jgi:hypothetical protein